MKAKEQLFPQVPFCHCMTAHIILNVTIEMKVTGLTLTGKHLKKLSLFEKDHEAFPRHKAMNCLINSDRLEGFQLLVFKNALEMLVELQSANPGKS